MDNNNTMIYNNTAYNDDSYCYPFGSEITYICTNITFEQFRPNENPNRKCTGSGWLDANNNKNEDLICGKF